MLLEIPDDDQYQHEDRCQQRAEYLVTVTQSAEQQRIVIRRVQLVHHQLV